VKKHRFALGITGLIAIGLAAMAYGAPQTQPTRAIALGPGGRLVYTADARGNRIPDFSFSGYMAGGAPIPDVPVRVFVPAAEGDCTDRIQAALDYVGTLAAGADGVRGAVLLGKGKFEVRGRLMVRSSGVVLRGSGFGAEGTLLVATGQDRRTLITVGGVSDRTDSPPASVVEEYVPVGSTLMRVPGHGFRVGQSIVVRRPCTPEWVHELGMDRMGGDRHGGGWRPGSRDIAWERTVTAADGDDITIDVPLTAALDKKYGGATVAAYTWPGRIRQVGVENLRCQSAFDAAKPMDEDHSWIAVAVSAAEDAWVRQVDFRNFVGGAVAVWETARRVTIEDAKSLEPVSEDAGSRRQTFFTAGQQTLFQRCYSEDGRHDFAVGFCAAGPNAFVQCVGERARGDSGPIDSWATGVLYDNVRIDGNELNLADRAYRAQQAGWSAANSVLWQCTAAVINCASPPTATNWAYGCWGQFTGNGEYASSRESIRPDSLYYAQLAERLGADVLKRADLMLVKEDASTNPTIEQAAALVAAAARPAPRLNEWIDAAAVRHPIPVDASGVKTLADLGVKAPGPATRPGAHPVTLRNGWLTRDGQVIVGGQRGITWWAGGVRPDDVRAAAKKEPNVTRFVPGRDGPGLTDDLDQLTDTLRASGDAALRHHYGLWYDTRDTDHERVRRADGDVWPPFYELPFLRSGRGTAWDGLSRYDLTRYNPWYWNRLRQFAELGERKGVLLIEEHYFQHNILEAGAHWASSPWRSVNNVNDTGFPEPPPYAGDKRIFLAEQFYDVRHPARAALHRAFIRKNLENCADGQGVIHETSAEFTGPLHFVEFWLDTIAQWEKETGARPLIALAATKDVQDAILADPTRAAVVSAIDVNYWWYQQDGKAYEPKGGQNLSPRQFERLLKPRPASFASIVRAVREYRTRYPAKAVIYSASGADTNGWAALMGGGSVASIRKPLPGGLGEELVAMRPFDLPGGPADQWALADAAAGSYLIYNAGAGPVRLDLPAGKYDVRWVDPVTMGVSRDETSGVAGGEFRSPSNHGASVLWVTRIAGVKS
jgi:hypothetical protein